jgi:hypothetical protein
MVGNGDFPWMQRTQEGLVMLTDMLFIYTKIASSKINGGFMSDLLHGFVDAWRK